MKITKQHYEHLKTEILKIPKQDIVIHKINLVSDNRVKDLEKRLRWDCFAAAKLNEFTCKNIYSYSNDDHIDTALKNIMKEIGV